MSATVIAPTSPIILSKGGSAPLIGFTAAVPSFPNSPFALTGCLDAVAGNTTYQGTITGYSNAKFIGQTVLIAGLFGGALNNGTFTIVGGSATTLIVNNPNGTFDSSDTGSATVSFIAPTEIETPGAFITIAPTFGENS